MPWETDIVPFQSVPCPVKGLLWLEGEVVNSFDRNWKLNLRSATAIQYKAK